MYRCFNSFNENLCTLRRNNRLKSYQIDFTAPHITYIHIIFSYLISILVQYVILVLIFYAHRKMSAILNLLDLWKGQCGKNVHYSQSPRVIQN